MPGSALARCRGGIRAVKAPNCLTHFDALPDAAHVGSAVVMALYGVSSLATLWKWERAGRIPRPRKLAGSRKNSWNVGELRAALAVQP